MNVIPYRVGEGGYSLFILLGEENINRMREYDPVTVTTDQLPVEWQELSLHEVIVGFATMDDMVRVVELARDGNMREGLKYLSRGFAFRPDQGDGGENIVIDSSRLHVGRPGKPQ